MWLQGQCGVEPALQDSLCQPLELVSTCSSSGCSWFFHLFEGFLKAFARLWSLKSAPFGLKSLGVLRPGRASENYQDLDCMNEAGRMILQKAMSKKGDKGTQRIYLKIYCLI